MLGSPRAPVHPAQSQTDVGDLLHGGPGSPPHLSKPPDIALSTGTPSSGTPQASAEPGTYGSPLSGMRWGMPRGLAGIELFPSIPTEPVQASSASRLPDVPPTPSPQRRRAAKGHPALGTQPGSFQRWVNIFFGSGVGARPPGSPRAPPGLWLRAGLCRGRGETAAGGG